MYFEEIRAALKKQTKSVWITYNFVLLFMMLVNVTAILMLFEWKTDKFNSTPDSEFIDCISSYTDDVDENGIAEFTVFMRNPFKKEGTFVGKLPAEKNEHLVLAGNGLVWHGTFDAKENKFQSPILYFQNGKTLENSTRRHYFALNCPSLKSQLLNASLDWYNRPLKPEGNLPSVEKDMMYAHQESNEIASGSIMVLKPVGNTVDVVLRFLNPYDSDVIIDKYPMGENETIVVKQKYVIWYGSFNLENREKFQKTLISFQKTFSNGVTRRHYYSLACPILEKKLEELTVAWWNNRNSWLTKETVLVVLYYTALGCLIGLVLGDFLARKALSKKLGLNFVKSSL